MPLHRPLPTNKFKLVVMKPYALKYGLEPAGDYARPGNSPPERAFEVLSSSWELAMEVCRAGFPSEDRRAIKKGGRWMLENIMYRSGPMGVQLLAVTLPKLFALSGGDLEGAIDGPSAPVEHHAHLADITADFFPLDRRRSIVYFNDALAEYDALPDQDPKLVADQRRWARDFLINEITYWASTYFLDADIGKLQDKIVRIKDDPDNASEEYRARLLDVWVRGSQKYRDYALLDAQSAE